MILMGFELTISCTIDYHIGFYQQGSVDGVAGGGGHLYLKLDIILVKKFM